MAAIFLLLRNVCIKMSIIQDPKVRDTSNLVRIFPTPQENRRTSKSQGHFSSLSSRTKCTAADQKLLLRQLHACAVMLFSSRLKSKFAWGIVFLCDNRPRDFRATEPWKTAWFWEAQNGISSQMCRIFTLRYR